MYKVAVATWRCGRKDSMFLRRAFLSTGRPTFGERLVRRVPVAATTVWVVLGKTKYLLAGLKLAKFSTLVSMGLSVGVYGIIFGLPYAAGFVAQIFIHESGHALAMRAKGIPFSPMVFVPFLGAAVQMQKAANHAYDEGIVALAGPVAGLGAACAVSVAGVSLDSQLLINLADAGFMINLFNLLPVGMLDGGRIAGALSRWNLLGGLGIGGWLLYSGTLTSPLFYLIMIMGSVTTFGRFFGAPPRPEYYDISARQKALLMLGTAGTIAALFFGMQMNARYKKTFEELRAETGQDPSALEELIRQETVQKRLNAVFAKLHELNPFNKTPFMPDGGAVVPLTLHLPGPIDERVLEHRKAVILRHCPEARFYSGLEFERFTGLHDVVQNPKEYGLGFAWAESIDCVKAAQDEEYRWSHRRRSWTHI